MLAEARDMTYIPDIHYSNFDINGVIFNIIEIYRVECFDKFVDNFVDKSLRALDVGRK